MQLNVNELKTKLNIMAKCKASNLLEITNYYNLHFDSNGLTITGFDGNNFISTFTQEGKQSEEVDIIVKSEQFTKLISKLTKEIVELNVIDNYLQVKADGTYKCEIFIGEDYPTYAPINGQHCEINLNQLKHGLEAGKNIKSKAPSDGPMYFHLLRGNNIVATDAVKVISTILDNFNDQLLIPPSLAELILVMDGENVDLEYDGLNIKLQSDSVIVYGTLGEGADQFPEVTPLISNICPYNCGVAVQHLAAALDRLKLFLGKYDRGLIDINFTNNCIILSTFAGTEIIEFTTQAIDMELAYKVNALYLSDIISAMKGDICNIGYGNSDFIQLKCNDDVFILAPCVDNE